MILRRILDIIELAFTFFYANRRLMIISITGLIIALASISQTVIYLDTIKGPLFSETLDYEGYYGHFDLGIHMQEIIPLNALPSNLINTHDQIIQQAFKNANMFNYYRNSSWWLEYLVRAYLNGTLAIGMGSDPSKRTVDLIGLNQSVLDSIIPFMSAGSYIPIQSNEVIILRPLHDNNHFTFSIGSNITLISSSNPGVNVSLVLSGIYSYDEINRNSLNSSTFDKATGNFNTLDPYWNHYFLLTTYENWFTILNSIIQYSKGNYNPIYSVNGRIFFHRELFNIFDLNSEQAKLKILETKLIDSLSMYNPYSNVINFFLEQVLSSVQIEFYNIFTFLIMFCLPIFGIALFLTIYAFGLIKNQKQSIVGLLKARGLSSKIIFSILVFENLLDIFIAIGISIILGIPFSFVSLKTNGLFSFNANGYPLIIDWTLLLEFIGTVGFVFGFLLSLKHIYSLSRISPIEQDNPFETQQAYWQSKYLDIIFTFLGLLGSVIIFFGTQTSDLPDETYFLVYLLGIPSPFLLIIGFSMLLTRLFPILFRFLGETLWPLQRGILAISWKNMLRHQQIAIRSVILLMLTFSFVITTVTIPISLENYYKESANYNIGADLYFPVPSFLSQPKIDELKQNITNLAEITPIIEQSRYYYQGGHQLLGIDPDSYANVTFQKSYYGLSDSLNALMQKLKEYNNSLLMFSADAARLDKHIGDLLYLTQYGFNNTVNELQSSTQIKFIIVGTFTYWPRLISQTPAAYRTQNGNDIHIVTNLSTAMVISNVFTNSQNWYGYLGCVDNLSNISTTVNEINLSLKNNATVTATGLYNSKIASPIWKISLGILNSNLLIGICIIFVLQILFAMMLITERRRENAIQRAIGMDLKQTFQLFLYETSAIIGFGILTGLILGSLVSLVFMYIALLQSLVPPFILIYPWVLYLFLGLMFFIFTFICTLVPAYWVSHKKLENVLR